MSIIGSKIKGVHPYTFRCGEWAVIKDKKTLYAEGPLATARAVYEVEYSDKTTDYIPLCDLDNYQIIEQVKPVVIGYKLIELGGESPPATGKAKLWSMASIKKNARYHKEIYGIKSKFRLVYAKGE